jgi:hypothetical protein
LVIERYVSYPEILDRNYEDVIKLNAILDFRQHYENEQNPNNKSNQANKLEFIKRNLK